MRYLSAATLELDPLSRLQEAAENPWYLLTDPVIVVSDEGGHHLDTTPVHEAAHAVAMTLAERQVSSVFVQRFPSFHRMGQVSSAEYGLSLPEMLARIGVHGLARDLVSTYAGPLAELRYNPLRAASGSRQDMQWAEAVGNIIEAEGFGDRHEWCNTAWTEACRMFSDDHVWAATVALADRLKSSKALIRAVIGGNRVRKVVKKHCPDGWQWGGIFAGWPRQIC